jgi:hypothetical protein
MERRGFLASLATALAGLAFARPGETTLALPSAALDTTIDVAAGHGTRLGAGYVLMNTRTREQLMVMSVMQDSITVMRGLGSIPMPFDPADDLIIVATPQEFLPASVDGPRERWNEKAVYPRVVKLLPEGKV